MNYFLCYDISDDKLRKKVAKYLERVGMLRVQKSIFFGDAYKPKQIQSITKKIVAIIKEAGDEEASILLIPVEKDHLNPIIVYGENKELKQLMHAPFSQYF